MANIKIEGLKPNTAYKFYVVAKNDDGTVQSAPSNIVSFTSIGDTTAPESPTALALDFSTTTMTATWNGTAAKAATDFLDYYVVITKPASSASQTFYTNNDSFYFTLDQNRKLFGETTPSASLIVSVSSRDTSGNVSTAITASIVNPPPSATPTVTYTPILKGFAATWPAPTFSDYAYAGVFINSTSPFSATDGEGTSVWKGNANAYEYSQYGLYNQMYIQVLFYDVFNQPGPNSNTGSITPIAPIIVDTTPPTNATALVITASNSGGATGMDGYIKATWTESTASDQRGTRLRFRAQGDQYFQYENSASGNSSYQINNLIPGYTYEVAIATYDEINNTSTFLLASPSAITIPFSTLPSLTTSACATTTSSNIQISGTVYASYVGQVISGWGLYPGTRITASYSGSVGVTPSPASAFTGSTVSLYPGVANWQSYITAGLSSSYMKIGTGVNGTYHGIWLDNNNYWYTIGNFRVGSNTSYFSWDGVTASISGDLRASSGSFFGNVKIGSGGSLYAGNNPASGARVVMNPNGIIGYNTSGINTFVLDATTGNFSASNAFITGSITANAGYIGGTSGWAVGTGSIRSNAGTGLIVLDGTNNKIYIGTGNYKNTDTSFYVDSSGSLSLKDKLYFDGSNLSINGSITANTGYIGGTNGWVIDSGVFYGGSDTNQAGMTTSSGVTFWSGGLPYSNLVSNPSFETNTTGWTLIAGTSGITRVTSDKVYGTAALEVAHGVSGNQGAYTSINVEAGKTYTLSAYVKNISGTNPKNMYLQFGWPGGTYSSTTQLSVTTAMGWTRISTTATSPTTGAGNAFVVTSTAGTTSDITRIDAVLVEPTSAATPYSETLAPFRVDSSGSVVATNANISGSIVANSGSIGSWSISTGSLVGGTTTSTVGLIPNATVGGVSIFAGAATPYSAPFYVTNTGSIVATSGSVGGWITNSNSFSSRNDTIYSQLSAATFINNNYVDYLFSAGNDNGASVTSYDRTMLAASATINGASQKLVFHKVGGQGGTSDNLESIVNIFHKIPSSYKNELGGTSSFTYDNYTGIVMRQGASLVSSPNTWAYMIVNSRGDMVLDSWGSLKLLPATTSSNGVLLGAGGTSGTPNYSTVFQTDISASIGPATPIPIYGNYMRGADGRYRYTLTYQSSSREKKNILNKFDISIENFMKMNPILYSWKGDETGKENAGFIVEEFLEIPELHPFITKDPSGKPLGIDYSAVVTLLVNVSQKQQNKINDLENKISNLENIITKLS